MNEFLSKSVKYFRSYDKKYFVFFLPHSVVKRTIRGCNYVLLKQFDVTPILRSLHWLKTNKRIEYKLLSLTYKVLTTSQPDYLHNLISVQSSDRIRSSSVVTLARPSVSSSLQIANRSFRYASPHLWNQLPSSFRQPHCVHSPPGSPHPTHITSSQSLITFVLTIYHSLDLSFQT